MNFQDSLKANMKTPTEIQQERTDTMLEMAHRNALTTMNYIRTKLIECVEHGNYIVNNNGEKIVATTVTPQPDYYWSHRKCVYSGNTKFVMDTPKIGVFEFWFSKRTRTITPDEHHEIRKMALDEACKYGNYNIKTEQAIYRRLCREYSLCDPPVYRTLYSMNFEMKKEYEVFEKRLTELAAQNNIVLHIYVSIGSELHEIYELPLTIEREKIENVQARLIIQCRCVIPEKYSTDRVIIAKDMNKQAVDLETVKEHFDIDNMNGLSFESFCADILKRIGYEQVIVTSGSGDQGIDVIAYKDGVKFGIQCKRHNADIGNRAVQEAFAGKQYYDCNVGVVLTNRYFTRSAKELAQRNGIVLWGRDELLGFMKKAGYDFESQ